MMRLLTIISAISSIFKLFNVKVLQQRVDDLEERIQKLEARVEVIKNGRWVKKDK